MKGKRTINLNLAKMNETLALLGKTRLIRRHDGLHELVGGTPEQRARAREWCEDFAPAILFTESRNPRNFHSSFIEKLGPGSRPRGA